MHNNKPFLLPSTPTILLVATWIVLACSGCSTWWTRDLNKTHLNYDPVPTNLLAIGDTRKEIIEKLGDQYSVVEKSAGNVEAWRYDQWTAPVGPDYIKKSTFLMLKNGKLVHWKTVDQTISLVPNTWQP